MTKMQNILTLETNKYSIKLNNFEGPLDLLCHLIDKNKMDIYDINLSEITDQYIEFLNQMEQMNLEVTSEFLVMSSTLLYLKSKHLLPKVDEEEEEITEEELIRRIIEYKKYKEITKKLKENFLEYSKRFYKGTEEIELPKQKMEDEYNSEIIPDLYKKLLQRNAEKINENAANIEKIAITETYTVGDKVKEMYRALIKYKKFNLAITPEGTRKANPNWKKGFYFIALKAQVPIVLIGIDYSKKTISATKAIMPSGDINKDMREIKLYFKDFKGKHPENFALGEI